ncbi:MAG TPA: MFS transporter [Micromonosporaceae bacterium]|nr:MFS transporter [Micromonosporaceae bacterium]
MTYQVRPVCDRDWDSIVRIEAAAYAGAGLSEERAVLESRGRASPATSFVLDAGGRLAGYLATAQARCTCPGRSRTAGRRTRMSRTRHEFRRSQLAVAALFCFLGLQYGTWAARIPALKARLDLTAAEVGVLLLACGVGAAVSFPLVARLMRQLGSRRLAGLSTLGLVAVLLALSVVPSYPTALVVLFADGVAVACLNVAMNAQGAALEAKYQRMTMAKLHAVFSGGTLCAALVASGVSILSQALPVHFVVAALVLLLLVGLAWPALLADDPAPPQTSQEEARREETRRRWVVPTGVTVWLSLAMVFGTVTEAAMTDWSALYLKDIAHAAAQVTPMGIAVFSAMMVLARLLADQWRARWGDKTVVVAGATVAGAGLALALVLGGVAPALVGFAGVGLGMAAVTPCIYVAAARVGSDALTLVAAMGTTGLLAGPPVIGFIASSGSLVWGMGAVAGSALLVSLCVAPIRWPEATVGSSQPTVAPPAASAEMAPADQ